jgi:hypothetical protein
MTKRKDDGLIRAEIAPEDGERIVSRVTRQQADALAAEYGAAGWLVEEYDYSRGDRELYIWQDSELADGRIAAYAIRQRRNPAKAAAALEALGQQAVAIAKMLEATGAGLGDQAYHNNAHCTYLYENTVQVFDVGDYEEEYVFLEQTAWVPYVPAGADPSHYEPFVVRLTQPDHSIAGMYGEEALIMLQDHIKVGEMEDHLAEDGAPGELA